MQLRTVLLFIVRSRHDGLHRGEVDFRDFEVDLETVVRHFRPASPIRGLSRGMLASACGAALVSSIAGPP
jgi:hypothetical protein